MDISITKVVSPHWFVDTVNRQLPEGLKVLEATPIGPNVPSLQSQVRFTQYQVEVKTDKNEEEIKTDDRPFAGAGKPALASRAGHRPEEL